MLLKIIPVLSLLICTIVDSRQVSLNSSWTIDNSKKESSFGYVAAFNNSHSLALVTCENYIEGTSSTNCELTVQTHEFSGKVTTRFCKLSQAFHKATHLYVTYSLAPNKAMITLTEDLPDNKMSKVFRIVNLEDCESRFVTLVSENTPDFYFHKLVVHHESFDVIYKNPSCPSNYCVVTYGFDGKLVKPTRGLGKIVNIVSFTDILRADRILYPNSEDYFLVDKVRDKANFIFSSSGKVTKQQISVVDEFNFANNSGIARVCWQSGYVSKEILCSQLEAGHVLNNLSVKIRNNVELLQVYNLPNGKFFAMVKIFKTRKHFDQFLLVLVNPDGSYEEVNNIEVDDGGNHSVTISENSENELCVSFLISGDSKPLEMYVKFYTRCLANEN